MNMNNSMSRIKEEYRMTEQYSRGNPVGTDAPYPVNDAPYPGAPMEERYGSMPLGPPTVTPGEIPTTLPDDGCLLLGKEETQKGIRYVYSTRFYIGSRKEQRKYVSQEIVRDLLTPCCDPEYTSTCGGQVWGCLRSEVFLFSLQTTALVLGILKILVDVEAENRDLHLTHAVLETSFSCIFIIIRSFIPKERFHTVKEARVRNEYVRLPGDSRSTYIKVWIFLQFLLGFTLCSCVVASFVVCYLYNKLGWIVVSNQFVMLLSTFLTYLTLHRLNHMITRIKEDQHKIIIHESALLLGELYWAQTEQQRSKAKQHVERFCKGLKMSSSFYRPEYIKCPEDLDWDIVTHMESGV